MTFQEYLGNCTEHLWLFCSILLYYPKQCLHLFRIHFALCSTARNHIVINLIIQKWQRMSEIFIKCWSQWHKSKSAIHEEKIEFYDITFLQETCKDQAQYYWLGEREYITFWSNFFWSNPLFITNAKTVNGLSVYMTSVPSVIILFGFHFHWCSSDSRNEHIYNSSALCMRTNRSRDSIHCGTC